MEETITEFRPLRRRSRAISDDEARELLLNEKRSVLAVNGDNGYPFAIPLDYLYEPTENRIYFHGARQGHKVDALTKSDKVCFTVFGGDFHKDGEWAPYVRSTVVFGRCRLVQITHPEALECVKRTRQRINQATSARMRCKRTGLVPHAARDDAARTGHGVGTGARGNKT